MYVVTRLWKYFRGRMFLSLRVENWNIVRCFDYLLWVLITDWWCHSRHMTTRLQNPVAIQAGYCHTTVKARKEHPAAVTVHAGAQRPHHITLPQPCQCAQACDVSAVWLHMVHSEAGTVSAWLHPPLHYIQAALNVTHSPRCQSPLVSCHIWLCDDHDIISQWSRPLGGSWNAWRCFNSRLWEVRTFFLKGNHAKSFHNY